MKMVEHVILEKSALFYGDTPKWRVVAAATAYKNVTQFAKAIVDQANKRSAK